MAEQSQVDLKLSALAVAVALLGTIARLPYWRYPPDLKLPDGSRDPRAGSFDPRKALSEISGVPALAMIGAAVSTGFNLGLIGLAGACAFFGLVGTSMLIGFVERALGPILTSITGVISSYGRKGNGK